MKKEYSAEEAKKRVTIKRKLRLAGLPSSYINDLETWELEELESKIK